MICKIGENTGMNILVLGNGFDLAHGLPTRYMDFLEFCKRIDVIYTSKKNYTLEGFEKGYLLKWNTREEIKEFLRNDFTNKKQETEEEKLKSYDIFTCIQDNIWIDYFFECNMCNKENWIDLEGEISKVIQSLDEDVNKNNEQFDDVIGELSDDFLRNKYSEYTYINDGYMKFLDAKHESNTITYKQIRDKLQNDLNRLIRALELYLTMCIENIECKMISPDIQQIVCEEDERERVKYASNVVCFNYTNTYEKLYLNNIGQYEDGFINFIHGKADMNNGIEKNNMVLGIDEYLPEDRRNKDVEFIAFKKFYQRIHKQTGCEYKEWMEAIKEQFEENEREQSYIKKYICNCIDKRVDNRDKEYARIYVHNLYIFGHSLDVTDRDILRDLILHDNVHTTIFYLNKEVMGQQIANLVKVIGQDELIKRTRGSTKTIEFKKQKDMVEIDNCKV